MSPPMGVIMPRITISGHPGSGTSTLVSKLSEKYQWTTINGGQVFRDEASRRGLSLSDFGKLCSKDEAVDRELDNTLKTIIQENVIDIVESRLAGWWAYRLDSKCIRLWLQVSDEERAKRVSSRENITFDLAFKENYERTNRDSKRYMKMYGIDPEQPEPYTHVVDATDIGTDEVFSRVVEILEASN